MCGGGPESGGQFESGGWPVLDESVVLGGRVGIHAGLVFVMMMVFLAK